MVWVVRLVSKLLKFIFVTFLRPGKNIKKLGSWAVVTGATDGIGLALAKEAAKKGLNVVLVSRSMDKLKAAEKEIKDKSPTVQTKIISFDFSKGSPADYAKLGANLRDLDIGILYNNVGVSYEHAEVLQDLTDERIENIMEVNNASLVKMTRLVLPGMLQRKKVCLPARACRTPTLRSTAPIFDACEPADLEPSTWARSKGASQL